MLKPWHREVMRQQYVGRKVKDIAESIDRSPGTVSSLINRPEYIKAFERFEENMVQHHVDVKARFIELAPEAQNTLVEVMQTAEDDAQRRLAANDILDRAGFPRVQKVEDKGPQIQIGRAQVSVLIQALEESRAERLIGGATNEETVG